VPEISLFQGLAGIPLGCKAIARESSDTEDCGEYGCNLAFFKHIIMKIRHHLLQAHGPNPKRAGYVDRQRRKSRRGFNRDRVAGAE
jgi:hypothetical protein